MNDTGGFEAFVREFQDMVFAVAIRLLGNAVEAEDVAQTVFLKAFERFDEIEASPARAGWLKTVTTNACLNHLARYRSRWRLFSELTREGSDAAEPSERLDALVTAAAPGGASTRADDALEDAERQAQLEQTLQALPDHQRVPLVLFHFEEKSSQEIATLTGVSLAKVKTDIHRGRDALRKALTGGYRPA
jgi:RNA polymerase sigma-70 factor (ECF subfamily)